MTVSLHAAVVPSYLQMLGAVAGLLDKAEAHCADTGLGPAEMLGRRIAPDMQPLSYQIKSTAVHSIGAIEGVRAGAFSPDRSPLPEAFAPLRARIERAVDDLAAIDPAEMESWIDRDMALVFGERRIRSSPTISC